jgi:hypothetical protein
MWDLKPVISFFFCVFQKLFFLLNWQLETDFLFIIYSFIHMCIHCLGHLSPLPPVPSPSSHPLTSRQNLFCPLLQFCWREKYTIIRKTAFLLVWHKDSDTEKFLALLPCTYVLQPELVHFYQTSSVLPGHIPIVISVSLRLLY